MSKYSIIVSGRYVGKVDGDTFKKSIKGSKHILRTPRAIALSVESLAQAEQAGAQKIEVKDKESGLVYSCTVTHFRQYAFDLQRGGYESQKALCLSSWNVSGGNAPSKSAVNVTPAAVYAAPSEIQLSLFGG